MPATTSTYRGRFAPSPSGPLHFGSLVAAVASYLQAHAQRGEWLVRIEDIDPPRESPAATDAILRALDAHGFEYAAPLFQSTRLEAYSEIIADLLTAGSAYPCACSRKMLRNTALQGRAGIIYPGTCRSGLPPAAHAPTAVRVRTHDKPITFTDGIQGRQNCRLESEIGDFLIRRGDGLVAYQLAVVADDHYQGITEVVRGTDLLSASFMQIWLRQLLHYDEWKFAHVPVATDEMGSKLSKQTGASEINLKYAARNIFHVFVFLGLKPKPELEQADLADLWAWGREHWKLQTIVGQQKIANDSMILQ